MMNASAAGHTFDEGRCRCGIFWVDIRNADYSDVGKPGIAHTGDASHSEITQIINLRTKEDAAIADAFGWR